jgi:hypothetical protein
MLFGKKGFRKELGIRRYVDRNPGCIRNNDCIYMDTHGVRNRYYFMNQALWEKANTFIRNPISGILIKSISLRSLRLCGEISFGQD